MSILPKRGTTSQISAAATANTLVPGEVIYDTTTNSLSVAVSSNSAPALSAGKTYAIGETITTAQDPGTGWLLCDGRKVSQSTYSALFSAIGHKYSPVRYPWTPVKINNPSVLPSGWSYGASWSPNNRYLAVAHESTPYITIYDWSSGSPVKISDPATLPTGAGTSCAWSPDGRYLAVMHAINPCITIYDWSTGSPVKISDPATLPPDGSSNYPDGSTGYVAWSPSGRYLAVAHGSSPYLTIYDWSSGAPVKITNPATLPTGAASGVAWSPNGRYLAVGHSNSPYITIYDWSSGAPVKIANPSGPTGLPGGDGRRPAWSPDSRYLAVPYSSGVPPTIAFYDLSTGSPEKMFNPSGLINGERSAAWSPNGKYLALSGQNSPYISIYDWTSASSSRLSNPAIAPTNPSNDVAWSPDSRYLAVAHLSSPRVTIYDGTDRPSTEFYLPKIPSNGGVKTYVKT